MKPKSTKIKLSERAGIIITLLMVLLLLVLRGDNNIFFTHESMQDITAVAPIIVPFIIGGICWDMVCIATRKYKE